MNDIYNKINLNKPLKYILIYYILSFVLFLWGPIKYYNLKVLPLIAYLITFIFFIYSSYKLSNKSIIKYESKEINENDIIKLLQKLLTIMLILQIIQYLQWAPIAKQSSIFNAFVNMAEVYNQDRTLESGLPFMSKVLTFSGVLTRSVLVLGFYYFEKFTRINKIKYIFYVLIIISYNLMFTGSVKLFGDLFIYFICLVMIKDEIYHTKKILTVGVLLFTIFILIFGYSQYSRMDLNDWAGGKFLYPAYLNENFFTYKIFDSRIAKTITMMIFYLSHGYYGLSLCLGLPFQWTFGVGSSFGLSSIFYTYFHTNNYMLTTYPIRMQIQTGWPALEYWSTIFTWLASDMTFLGAILFLSILIFIWAKSWREAIVFKNPLSIVLFCNLGILWIFVPQNNQLMQTLESTVATILLVLIWLIFHKYFNNIKEVNKEKSIDANK